MFVCWGGLGQVECSYCIAQILDIFEDKQSSYALGDVTTSVFLIVAFDMDKTLARLSYISDGLDISKAEYARRAIREERAGVLPPAMCFLKPRTRVSIALLPSPLFTLLPPRASPLPVTLSAPTARLLSS